MVVEPSIIIAKHLEKRDFISKSVVLGHCTRAEGIKEAMEDLNKTLQELVMSGLSSMEALNAINEANEKQSNGETWEEQEYGFMGRSVN